MLVPYVSKCAYVIVLYHNTPNETVDALIPHMAMMESYMLITMSFTTRVCVCDLETLRGNTPGHLEAQALFFSSAS